ncbi:FAD-dependent oxidoreductase [Herbiconiux daphne]|uniref:FAD-dependent oxidoreductase n=1 Tax=Herbiconiux daphne TaxID=2970914 RepID=A0ABT2GW06_9MICO|nr:FAD-dependent oxidoreductase [Herbiconiux daphne]MCS5732142.1 FAD-dependent oxidoreductase [Herbiconiux daphne]
MQSLWLDGRRPLPTHPFLAEEEYDDVIVGAGITGLSTALMLAEAGRRVAVIEAFDIGALATGNTTGKISLLQGSRLSTIRRHHSRRVLQAYVDSNRDGQEWLLDFCERAGVPVQRRTAYSYAQHADGADAVEAEYRAAREVGLPVGLVDDVDVPFPFAFGVALGEQAQFDAMDAVVALARELMESGGIIHTGVRVTGVKASSPARVITPLGEVRALNVVLATATPILDRGLYFAKTHGQRSYALAFEVPDAGPGDLPDGMFLSIGDSVRSRSVRTAPRDGRDLLVVGGNGHGVGRAGSFSEQDRVDDLRAWSERHYPGARLTNSWSAQDYESFNLIPFVGALPRGRGRVYLATGFAKWGMTNGVAAGIRLSSEILGDAWSERRHWHRVLATRMTKPADLGRGGIGGAEVGAEAAKGWLGAERRSVPVARPAEGEGVVANANGRPVGISTVGGTTCAVSAVCPHLGGVLAWNDAERSWDCPLHASRFTAEGTRIEGPAVDDLRRLPRTPSAARR